MINIQNAFLGCWGIKPAKIFCWFDTEKTKRIMKNREHPISMDLIALQKESKKQRKRRRGRRKENES